MAQGECPNEYVGNRAFGWLIFVALQHMLSGSVAAIKYVILWKLEFHREGGGAKHLRDIKGILAVSSNELDFKILAEVLSALGLSKSWALCEED